MRWLFGERFCLETKLKPEFVMGLLRENVDRTRWQPGDAIIGPKPLFDKLTVKEEGRFVLWPSSELRRNSFRPIWKCELEGEEGGSRLWVRAGNRGAFQFYILLFGFFGYWGYCALRGSVVWDWVARAFGLSAVFLLLSLLCFWLPERKAKTVLQRILGGTLIDSK
ncbi:MAG: hypothetical protein HFF06_00300 [Oscillospiraceae bacterium]|nr:hypothetical protein [Oscillospiraceae bacterium]